MLVWYMKHYIMFFTSYLYTTGISAPGRIKIFDSKGEIMIESKFLTGIVFCQADYEGGIGIHEAGNRGTKHGLNM